MSATKCIWDDFTNQYSLSKTLRFELKPVGKTAENIKTSDLLNEDKKRAEEFKQVKLILNDYYRDFIEKVLYNVEIDSELLSQYYEIYTSLKKMKKSDLNYKNKLKEFKKINLELRKSIFIIVSEDPKYDNLFKAELLKDELPLWLKEHERLSDFKLISKFRGWGTYFVGFFKNRENIFSKEEISTSLIYRIVNDNLPKYIDNLENYNKLLEEYSNISFDGLENELKEELENKTLSEFFTINHFNRCLNQSGIDKYNTVLGGKFLSGKDEKIKGFNEYVNLYSQQLNDKLTSKKVRRMKLAVLFKQILSEKQSHSFVIEKFEDDNQLISSIKDFSDNILYEVDKENKSLYEKLNLLCADFNSDKYDLEKIYLSHDSLKNISVCLYGDYSFILNALKLYAEELFPMPADKNVKKILDQQISWVEKKYHSISDINNALKYYYNYLGEGAGFKKLSYIDYNQPISSYISNVTITQDKKIINIYEKINETSNYLNSLLSNDYVIGDKKLLQDSISIEIIKEYLESVKMLIYFLNPLYVKIRKQDEDSEMGFYEKDSLFYGDFDILFTDLKNNGTKLYDKVRNYITQKPYSTKKFKLNFDNSTLLKGWDYNKVKDNWGILLKKDNNYYLGILKDESKSLFTNCSYKVSNNNYELVNYKLISGPNKMLPKVFLSDKGKAKFKPSEEILSIYQTGEFKKGDNFNLSSCHKLIDYFKMCLPIYKVDEQDKYGWEVFNFNFTQTSKYKDISEFYHEVEEQGYKLWFEPISQEYIDQLVDEGKIFLFQIWNKDFSNYSKGKKNLHTYYWQMLFDQTNLEQGIYKLNGEAELFYREASIPKNITHPKNVSLENKDPINNKKVSRFSYDLIKDKRYSEDKYFFYCPITLNFKSKNNKFISGSVKDCIYENDNINILSIDRGERHLLYYTLLNYEGLIIKQGTLNEVKDDVLRTKNYKFKLAKREEERDLARKNWKNIETIKELKEGYLSQIVHTISNLAIENNAVIVLEDLNFGFKRGRFKIERQVYQKFEKALIDKLNYFVIKNRDANIPGGLLHAYQLTNQFESFNKLGKQSGILFYVPAQFTSKIDPKTGFINLLYPKYETIIQSKNFLEKFKYVKYHSSEDIFELNFNYRDFDSKNEIKLIRDNWSIWSNGLRLINRRDPKKNNSWNTLELNLTEELKKLFESYNINYKTGNDFKQEFSRIEKKEFFESLIKLLKYTLQLRNSYTESEIEKFKHNINFNESDYDYILSCVKDKTGIFFDSRKAKIDEPLSADANGAYHIGLKGLIMMDKIRKNEKDLKIDRNMFINNIIKRNE
jgi:CRISPR-associated protein Cpf1